MNYTKLKYVAKYPTGKLNSNAAVVDGEYPFFTCAHEVYKIDRYAYEGEYVLLGGNNANGDFPIFYYNGKFEAYQRTYLIQPIDKSKYDTHYLFYAIGLKLELMKGNASGTATKFLTQPILDNISIEDWDITYQRRIVDILSQYDQAIENNNKRIKILEQMAENLYKEWFVRFRFPGHEDVEFEGGIPDWDIVKLHEYVDIKAGGDRPDLCNDSPSEGCEIPVYSNGIENDGLYGYTDKAVIEKESITISARGTVGFVCLRRTPFVPIVRLLALTPKSDDFSAVYLYYLLKYDALIGNGTSQQQITVPMVQRKKVLKPNKDLVQEFSIKAKSFWKLIDALREQNSNLIKQRDLLLPRLMSGKLEVK